MNTKLFHQIKNEWRSNMWLIAELLLVSCVLWFLVDGLYVKAKIYTQPRGFDISHCYLITIGTLSSNDVGFVNEDTVQMNKDYKEMMDRLARRSEVEAVSLSQNSYPYNGSNASSGPIKYGRMANTGNSLRRTVTPDFFRVFRYEGARGETPEQLSKLLSSKDVCIASDNIFQEYGVSMKSLISKKIDIPMSVLWDTKNDNSYHTVAASIKPVRYDDFYDITKHSAATVVILAPEDSYIDMNELCVRVKADKDVKFMENLWHDSDKQFRVGNIYISNIESFSDIRKDYSQDQVNDVRNYLFGVGFLMFNIFLGLLGTFWFRTQQRRSEIALFKALGATNRSVFGREIAEGLLLLTIATIPAVIIDWNLAFAELTPYLEGYHLEASRFIITVVITWLLIALMIVLGNWLPANKAVQVQPAEALHEE